MKILMVCTHRDGGATIAARRQAESLHSLGVVCDMVSVLEDWKTPSRSIEVTREGYDITLNVPASSWSYNGRITLAVCEKNRSEISNTWFSFFPTETCLDTHLLNICLEYDVIHFHWTSQLVSARFLAELAKHDCRILVTSHDMNYFTGGCHYDANCGAYRKGCEECPQLIADPFNLVENSFYKKVNAFAAHPITWLFPSEWLAGCFSDSKLQDNPHATKVINNCIDTKSFNYLQSEERFIRRSKLNFSNEDLVLVAGTADNTELRKGFQFIASAIKNLECGIDVKSGQSKNVVIVTFGKGKPPIETDSAFIRHQHLGSIDEQTVISLFQSADILLMSSTEENFANTILESLMCGCPVLAFNIGGVPDIVEHGVNGWLVEDLTEESYSRALQELINEKKLPELMSQTHHWRDINAKKYDYSVKGPELLDIYRNNNDITKPRSIKRPSRVKQTEVVYTDLFGWFTPNDVNSHQVLAKNVAQHIQRAQNQRSFFTENNQLALPAIFKGFSNIETDGEMGCFGWLSKRASVFYQPRARAQPALCIQVPMSQSNSTDIEAAYLRLKALHNGESMQVELVESQSDMNYEYWWLVPNTESLTTNGYFAFELYFDKPSISEDLDARGLCLRYCQVAVFDLSKVLPRQSVENIPNHELSTVLFLKTSQEQYFWENWTEQQHTTARLPNLAMNWIDLINGSLSFSGQRV